MFLTNWESYGGGDREIKDQKNIRDIKQVTREQLYTGSKISDSGIEAIRESFSRIPILFADFDDTLTSRPGNQNANRSIFATLEILEAIQHNHREIKAFRDPFITDRIDFFYSRVLRGLNRGQLSSLFSMVVEDTDPRTSICLNHNLFDVCKRIHRNTGAVRIPLVILSLNSTLFIKIWYESKREEFEAFHRETGIEIVLLAIIGNHIVYDEEENVIGVIQHVTNENKHRFIPNGYLILADIRETRTLLNRSCNVVNLEDVCYNYDVVDISIECNRIVLSKERIIRMFSEVTQDMEEILELAREIKRKNESRIQYSNSRGEMGILETELRIDIRQFRSKYFFLNEKVAALQSQKERRES